MMKFIVVLHVALFLFLVKSLRLYPMKKFNRLRNKSCLWSNTFRNQEEYLNYLTGLLLYRNIIIIYMMPTIKSFICLVNEIYPPCQLDFKLG